MSVGPISYDLQQAAIECCGRVFHWKNNLKALLLRCGVSENVWLKYEQEAKFKIARAVFSDLDQAGENGKRIQHRIIAEFARMQTLPDQDVPDKEAAKNALLKLKKLASTSVVVSADEERRAAERAKQAEKRAEDLMGRASSLGTIRDEFNNLVMGKQSKQVRGYSLEDILQKLFMLNEIEYHPPYRTSTEQIDGWFSYDGTQYLVEARWRETTPTKGDILEFQGKVRGKLHGTRGLFVSAIGFRDEVVADLDKAENCVLLMDGRDLMHILEDRIGLIDGLEHKITQASKRGVVFAPLLT
jgi:hypothetical protein